LSWKNKEAGTLRRAVRWPQLGPPGQPAIGIHLAVLRSRFSSEFEFAVFIVFLMVFEVRNDSEALRNDSGTTQEWHEK
jgi:hypothetical protein